MFKQNALNHSTGCCVKTFKNDFSALFARSSYFSEWVHETQIYRAATTFVGLPEIVLKNTCNQFSRKYEH